MSPSSGLRLLRVRVPPAYIPVHGAGAAAPRAMLLFYRDAPDAVTCSSPVIELALDEAAFAGGGPSVDGRWLSIPEAQLRVRGTLSLFVSPCVSVSGRPARRTVLRTGLFVNILGSVELPALLPLPPSITATVSSN